MYTQNMRTSNQLANYKGTHNGVHEIVAGYEGTDVTILLVSTTIYTGWSILNKQPILQGVQLRFLFSVGCLLLNCQTMFSNGYLAFSFCAWYSSILDCVGGCYKALQS